MLEKSMNQEPFLINQEFPISKESSMIYQGEDVKKDDIFFDGSLN